MFQKVKMTPDMWVYAFIFLAILWLFFLVDLMRKGEWKKCFIFTGKCILTIPLMFWVDTMNLFVGGIISTLWGFFLFNND